MYVFLYTLSHLHKSGMVLICTPLIPVYVAVLFCLQRT